MRGPCASNVIPPIPDCLISYTVYVAAMESQVSIVAVGGGNMGGALVRGWLRGGRRAEHIRMVDPALPDFGDVRVQADAEGLAAPDVLLLAVKPQMLGAVAPGIAALAGRDTILVSVLAAVEIAVLRRHFPQVRAIVRTVPNLPTAIGKGVTALASEPLAPAEREQVGALFAMVGGVEWLDREMLCDAATSVSGCGPAFLFRFADAVAEAGVAQGLEREQALRLFAHTMIGAGTMLLAEGADPFDMARRVASPGGVTQAGLGVFDEGEALRRLVASALAAAAARNAEMVENARIAGEGAGR